MAQDEKMVVPVKPTDAMVEAAYEHWLNKTGDAGRYVVRNIIKAALSAAPAQPATDMAEILRAQLNDKSRYLNPAHAQPAAVEGAGEPVAWQAMKEGRPLGSVWPYANRSGADLWVAGGVGDDVRPLYAHPSPPAAEAASRNNVTSGDEVWVKAKASDVCTSCCGVCIPTIHERGVYTYVHWSSVSLSPTPAADDALRVAVEALEDAAHEAHGRGYVQGFADAVWDETGDYDEKALTENLDPEKLRDGWYDDARHTYRDAQTEALAALKAGGVK